MTGRPVRAYEAGWDARLQMLLPWLFSLFTLAFLPCLVCLRPVQKGKTSLATRVQPVRHSESAAAARRRPSLAQKNKKTSAQCSSEKSQSCSLFLGNKDFRSTTQDDSRILYKILAIEGTSPRLVQQNRSVDRSIRASQEIIRPVSRNLGPRCEMKKWALKFKIFL